MIAILLVLAGFAVIFGAKGATERLTKLAVGLVLIVTFLPGLLFRAGEALGGLRNGGPLPGVYPWLPLTALAVLAGVGFAAWKLRGWRARRREARLRRHSSPRERSRPPAPDGEGRE